MLEQDNKSEIDLHQSASFSPLDNDQDEDSIMAHFNESDERFQSYSNEGESEDLSMVLAS
jgi:hypothetical protein